MLTYEQWDAIADSYIPLLALLCLLDLVIHIKSRGLKTSIKILMATFVGVIFIYAMMFLDQALHIWPSFSVNSQVLDYSTHTALAWAFLVQLMFINKTACYVSITSTVLYGLLMLFQNYHSLADIVTTTLAVLPILYMLHKKSRQAS